MKSISAVTSRLNFGVVVVCFFLIAGIVLLNYNLYGFDIFRKQKTPLVVETIGRNSSSSSSNSSDAGNSPSCPEYFRWIHDDLRPWRKSGITEKMVEKGRKNADFRLVVLNGNTYVETYRRSFQTRDIFTIWGILQLLRKYPGRIPDLDLNFFCGDLPRIKRSIFSLPVPLFSYCSNNKSDDIPFPDWSFWGWPEINIKPWTPLMEEIMEGNKKLQWVDRKPYAYWKGNPYVSGQKGVRVDLMKCNLTADADWHARLFRQDWVSERKNGFRQSNLVDKCKYRYMIYVEGNSWSVSQKYILACDSAALLVTRRYHDFFSRGIVAMKHYYPIDIHNKCRSINKTVCFGNSHPRQAQIVGKEGSEFIRRDLNMDRVYDYMFHLLNEYSKLIRFKPKLPENPIRVSSKSMSDKETGLVKKFMMDSKVKPFSSSSSSIPCSLPPPFAGSL